MSTPATEPAALAEWLAVLRCPICHAELTRAGNSLACESGHSWPIRDGTLRFVEAGAELPGQEERLATSESFAYEWERFGGLRAEWERNFLDYMQPHDAEFFDGLRVVDAGAGSGRHSRQAALYGARVVAVDLGDSIDVACANTPDTVLTIQSDLEALPLAPGSFDFVMSIGVLHHLPNTERALNYLVQFARPGGRVRVYLYWQPERRWQRAILRGVSAVRRATTRMPHRLLHTLCYPLAVLLWVFVVAPYRALRSFPPTKSLAEALPLKTYADYPFGVLVNDQFDRFSAPIERRFTRPEVEALLVDAGLSEVIVRPNHGWVAEGTRQ